jgi:hypothetical protein
MVSPASPVCGDETKRLKIIKKGHGVLADGLRMFQIELCKAQGKSTQ